jgi:protein-S-isoprenylcysteine O-methyltransferase Ste14
MRFFSRTPVRTFIIYPVLVIVWELIWNRGSLDLEVMFLPLMGWGYLQYRLCGRYCIKQGGGGPGLETPPDRIVSTGPYAYTRNPMYLGHLIYLLGLSLTLQSWLGAVITIAVALWFQRRVIGDEDKLATRLGKPYIEYMKKVPRWI